MNMGALVWGIGGGLLFYFLTCNFLTLLVKPSWDEPIRTISDLLERDMGLILLPWHDHFIGVLRDSPVDQYNKESFFYSKIMKLSVSISSWPIRLYPSVTVPC